MLAEADGGGSGGGLLIGPAAKKWKKNCGYVRLTERNVIRKIRKVSYDHLVEEAVVVVVLAEPLGQDYQAMDLEWNKRFKLNQVNSVMNSVSECRLQIPCLTSSSSSSSSSGDGGGGGGGGFVGYQSAIFVCNG